MEEDAELKVSVSGEGRVSNCHSPIPQDPTDASDVTSSDDKEVVKEEQDGASLSQVKLTDASLHAVWPLQHQGVALNELVINSYTLSEVLRLHLLSAGGYQDDSERRTLRYQRRGGYTDKDNPAIAFGTENAGLLDSLQHKCLFDMDVEDRIAILKTLCSELLTFTTTRDAIEESKHKWKKANRTYQELVKKEGHQDKKKIKKKKNIKEKEKDKPAEGNKKDEPTMEEKQMKVEASNIKGIQKSEEE